MTRDIQSLLRSIRPVASLRIAIMMGVLTLLSGCIFSYKPLFDSSAFPFPSGTQFIGKSPASPDEPQQIIELTIENGGYTVKAETKSLRCKLHPLAESSWLVMMYFSETEGSPYYMYSLLRLHNSSVEIGVIDKDSFLSWARANNIVTGWKEEEDSIEVNST